MKLLTLAENILNENRENNTLISTLKTEIINLKSENQHLREQIESLQQKLENIAIQGVKKHSQIINNNTNITQILSPFDLDQD